mgnify:CR=1 FL=1
MPAVSVGYEPPYLAGWLADNQSRCIVLAKIGHTLHVFKDTYLNQSIHVKSTVLDLGERCSQSERRIGRSAVLLAG